MKYRIHPKTVGIGLILAIFGVSNLGLAHHSTAPYDDEKIVDLEGVVVEMRLINPHFKLKVEVTDALGAAEIYEFHRAGSTFLKNTGVDLADIQPGATVKVASNLAPNSISFPVPISIRNVVA